MALLKREQIRYAFFHVRDLKPDGSLTYHHRDKARALTSLVHSRAPGVKAIAWIYVSSATVDMSNPNVRSKAISEAQWLCDECGFDGIQWDYEFALNGGKPLLQLLDATRTTAPSMFVSVATPMWYPGTLWGWSDSYYRAVAERCDQIAVMCYDSFFYLPRAYVWLLTQQALHVPAAARGTRCKVLLGIPTYDPNDGTTGHGAGENIGTALKGVRLGLAAPGTNLDNFEGIAPFAEYTTTPDEWQVYEKYWL